MSSGYTVFDGSATVARRRTTTEQRILEAAAAALVGGTRFSDLTVETVLELAGVSRSSFYKFFADKAALVQRLAEPSIGEAAQASTDWWHGTPASSWRGLAATVARMLTIGRANSDLWQAYFDAAAADPDVDEALRGAMESHAEMVAQRISALQEEELATSELQPIHLARFMIRTTLTSLVDHLQHGDRDADEAITRTLGRSLWFGVFGH
ncbi:TetR/AcrR family transcriptional regulator [Mycolicibacterium sp. CBMA 226]|uniref:TetR/AcrR family transcriptional regulator n=1 Tax=Mycolicibacterium sp. CBMA 226 TaxID=2606611 RepID=UPI0012DD5C5C|nr:TetR/AcrR family transcriptional regulator [Mycolicibacterium sp. CBMA 226]MUL78734.1 TetR/AcrR family transcriptional regulator [Mycolicibacterium sp. CBMA 226]